MLLLHCNLQSFYSRKYDWSPFPDFGTFFRHHIADIENQAFSSKVWVTQGDASKILLIFAPCLLEKNVTVLVR